ncbi:MAG: dihydrolipoamide acetyltransferase family protein [Saprospiraceae bacterium]
MVHDLIMPKMGESITEATILKWLLKEGDLVDLEQPILEIATDKVDSEITSPVQGKLVKIFFNENEVIPIGMVIAKISDLIESVEDEYESVILEENGMADLDDFNSETLSVELDTQVPYIPQPEFLEQETISQEKIEQEVAKDRFYSPLVRTIAKEENITRDELDSLKGTGAEGRVTKSDILQYVDIKSRKDTINSTVTETELNVPPAEPTEIKSVSFQGEHEIIEMDRMRRFAADHMLKSKQTSPHVTSFIEVDVTKIVKWREKNKLKFQEKFQQNITYTPIFLDSIIKTIKQFPLINSSVNGYQIILKKDINIGMATALANGNLIVPVIKKADLLNLQGLVHAVNDLASRARLNQLKPDEVMGGTFTVTNIGSFDSLMGTPIINQPQVAILAIGSIKKKPIVMETDHGDVIGIGHCMFMSLSYDHRIINGFLGGSFLKKIADFMETFDPNTSF